jgi:cytochrome c
MRRRLLVALLAVWAVGCSGGTTAVYEEVRTVTGGEPERGLELIGRYGCGACHDIPGVRGASATVGPPLGGIALRSYLAGQLSNTPENMRRWIQQPQHVEPGTAMPDMGVTDEHARDITAYLYTLR